MAPFKIFGAAAPDKYLIRSAASYTWVYTNCKHQGKLFPGLKSARIHAQEHTPQRIEAQRIKAKKFHDKNPDLQRARVMESEKKCTEERKQDGILLKCKDCDYTTHSLPITTDADRLIPILQ